MSELPGAAYYHELADSAGEPNASHECGVGAAEGRVRISGEHRRANR